MSVCFGPFRLDSSSRELSRDGSPVRLTPKAFELLRLLVENRPRAMSKTELADALWPDVFVSDEGLPRLINEVRVALDDSARCPTWIRTLHGFGYSFLAESFHADEEDRFCISLLNQEIPLGEGEHLIGREAGARVHLAASMVSRRHARIVVQGHQAVLEDLSSKNGTYVGNRRVTAQHLHDRDEIRIGDVTLLFRTVGVTPTKTHLA